MSSYEKKQSQSMVVYKNELNTVALRNFKATEMDLLFTMLSVMRDKGETELTFDFQDLKELSNYKPTATDRFVDDLERTYDKLIDLNIKVGDDRKWTKFVLFTKYTVDLGGEQITIGANPEFSYLINNLQNNFTRFELEEMVHLNSSYSKAAYRLLKQYRKTGFYRVSVENFRKLMDIPESYEMFNIRQRIFKQLEVELPQYFENFNIHEVKGKGKKKRSTVELLFTFTPEYDLKTDPSGKVYIATKDKDGEYKNVYAEDMNSNQIESVYESADDYQKKYLSDLIQLKKDQIKFDDF